MASTIKVDQIQSDSGNVSLTGNVTTSSSSIVDFGSGQFYKDTNGNVGIGTNTPNNVAGTNLHVSAANLTARIILESTGGSGRQYRITTDQDGRLNFFDGTAGNFRAAIDSIGNFQMDSGYGTVATAYGCRAWVNFNGTGTVAIRASGNVTSITDNGTGDYTVNFTTAMPDSNYAVFGTGVNPSDQVGVCALQLHIPSGFGSAATLKTTTQVRMLSRRDSNLDIAQANISIFR
jgi:hypothetical protein